MTDWGALNQDVKTNRYKLVSRSRLPADIVVDWSDPWNWAPETLAGVGQWFRNAQAALYAGDAMAESTVFQWKEGTEDVFCRTIAPGSQLVYNEASAIYFALLAAHNTPAASLPQVAITFTEEVREAMYAVAGVDSNIYFLVAAVEQYSKLAVPLVGRDLNYLTFALILVAPGEPAGR